MKQKNLHLTLSLLAFTLAGTATFQACKDDKNDQDERTEVKLENHSKTPVLLKKLSGFANLELYSLFSSEDEFAGSPGYRFGGSADGAGLIKDPGGDGYIMLVNNEDNYSLSRISFDGTFKPVKGEYVLNSDAGQWRLCSGTMATPAEHGFGPTYLCVGESKAEAQTHKINPLVSGIQSNSLAAGLGQWSGENAVPLPKDAYPGKTIVLLGEDADDASGGQLVLYVSNTVGDLENGTQYMLKRKDGNQKEMDMQVGSSYDVEFVKIENHKALTGAQIQALTDPLQAIKFGRVEDIDYRKGSPVVGREVYFNVTGQDYNEANLDHSRTRMGRTYRITLEQNDPTKGKLECILDGDDDNGIAKDFQNPDNICVTKNYVYIQEDSNTYGTETHDGYIYQYNIATKELKKVVELDHRRDDPKFKATAARGNWEYGALIDVSDIIGVPDTFTLCIQPHTWKEEAFRAPDKGSKRKDEVQGSQVVLIKGLAR